MIAVMTEATKHGIEPTEVAKPYLDMLAGVYKDHATAQKTTQSPTETSIGPRGILEMLQGIFNGPADYNKKKQLYSQEISTISSRIRNKLPHPAFVTALLCLSVFGNLQQFNNANNARFNGYDDLHFNFNHDDDIYITSLNNSSYSSDPISTCDSKTDPFDPTSLFPELLLDCIAQYKPPRILCFDDSSAPPLCLSPKPANANLTIRIRDGKPTIVRTDRLE